MNITDDRLSDSQSMSFAGFDSAVPGARRWVAAIFDSTDRSAKTPDAALIVSELVTNAIRAAPGRMLELTVTLNEADAVIAVWDPNAALPVVRSDLLADLDGDVDHNGGRGLFLVMAAAKEWGCTPSPARGGKWVWARL